MAACVLRVLVCKLATTTPPARIAASARMMLRFPMIYSGLRRRSGYNVDAAPIQTAEVKRADGSSPVRFFDRLGHAQLRDGRHGDVDASHQIVLRRVRDFYEKVIT